MKDDSLEAFRTLLDSYFAAMREAGHLFGVAKPPSSVGKGRGVPPEMLDGEPDEEGWARWKVLPSALPPGEVARLEEIAGAEFPPLFRAYLEYGHFMDVEGANARLPGVASDTHLAGLASMIRHHAPLARAGFVVFGEDGNDAGPLCFDCARREPDGDCPIVLFDHETLAIMDAAGLADRARLLPHAQPFAASFAELARRVFTITAPLKPSPFA